MTTTRAATRKLHVVKVEDREGTGTCTACGREGLRWIVTLSDGTQVGTEINIRTAGQTAGHAAQARGAKVSPGAIPAPRSEAGTHRSGPAAVGISVL